LSSIVEELRELEQGYVFVDYRKLPNDQNTVIKVFLIGACCDKPAQALVQNIAEPIAAFGCGRCEIEGEI
jgi:thioredoxin reductase